MSDPFPAVYGPVTSWRYGRSLGIDPIGPVSTCSFNCVYCQLGEIEHHQGDRRIFIPTAQILTELSAFSPWDVDVITLSGSGEPTLAENLGEILAGIHRLTHRPTLVLTNATLLADPHVRQALALADKVAVKLDALSPDQLRRLNRPIPSLSLEAVIAGIQAFQTQYTGHLSVQTMVMTPWDAATQQRYIDLMHALAPQEIQLNTPTRPKPLQRELDGRGNHTGLLDENRPFTRLKCVSPDILQQLATTLQTRTGIPVRYAPPPPVPAPV